MAKYRPLQPVRYFFEPITANVDRLDRPAAYRCDECGEIQRPTGEPLPCMCGASPASLMPVKKAIDLDDFRLPPDLGGLSFEFQDESFPLCFGCNHYECWHREPTRTCGLGLAQHSYWSASERPRIRLVNPVCWSLVA